MRFDARTAKLLAPGKHMKIDGAPGLRLEATATRRTWTYRFKSPVDGRMRQIRIGAWPAISPAAAIAEWEKLRQRRDDGEDLAIAKRTARTAEGSEQSVARGGRPTVKQVWQEYVVGHIERHRKLNGAKQVRRMFETFCAPIDDLDASTLSRAQAFELIDSLNSIPVQANVLRRELGAAWDYAFDAGRLAETVPNWWRRIMKGRLRSKGRSINGVKSGPVKRVLSEQELAALVHWLPNFSETVRDALSLYLWTGTRGAEIASMHSTEISEEPDGLWWTIPKGKTKNARHAHATDLRVPLVGRAEEVVRRRLQSVDATGYIFVAKVGGQMRRAIFDQAVYFRQPYCPVSPKVKRDRLSVSHWTPHDLRRSVRTQLAVMGCPDGVAEAVLGHMPKGIVGIYNRHNYDRERRMWLERWSERLNDLTAITA